MADNSRSGSFFRNLRNSIPYQGGLFLDLEHEIDFLNPKFKEFENRGSKRQDILQKHSITYGNPNDEPYALIGGDNNVSLYANIQENKLGRIKDYRIMAAYPVVSECIDNICDEMINLDDVNNIIKIDIDQTELKDSHKQELEDEFKSFMAIYDLEQNGWSYARNLLVEGELFFEHIIDKSNPGLGILGVVPIPVELIDPIYDNMQNFMIRGFLERKPILDPKNPNKIERYEYIPMDKNQIAYMNSGIWNEDHTCRIPYIENGRKDYRRLSLIEDSIVIYRLARAPERLIFNIDVGNMNTQQQQQYLQGLMHKYWNSKTFDIANGGVTQKFDPQSMLDAFWFPKRKGSEGSSVSTLPAGQNLSKLEDLEYFRNALYTSLGVPTNRTNPEDKAAVGAQNADILRAELKFARLVIRLQKLLANGFKNSFITHLKLKKYENSDRSWWEEFNLSEDEIKTKMNPPSNYYQLREIQKLELSMNLFTTAKGTEFISPSLAAKDYLKWDDTRLQANQEWKRKDAAFAWEITQITNQGPGWKKLIQQNIEAANNGGEPDINGGLGASNSMLNMGNSLGGLEEIPSNNNGGTGGADDLPPDFGGNPSPQTTETI